MKKIIYLLLILNLGLLSCVDDASVRVMPEFNCKDTNARELNFEGVRWPLLKRLGLLGERVKAHYGETKAENPYLDKDYAECRTSFVVGQHECWPIPQEQIDLMGKENFPQNENWY